MPDNSPPNRNPPIKLPPASSYELLTQLTNGPSNREVVATTLRSALKEQYPSLDIDPDLAMVVTPRWSVVDDAVEPQLPFIESLTTVLARQMLAAEPIIYMEGEHFLTLQTDTWPVHLPVKIDAVARLLNELSPLLYAAFQEQQLDYWNADDDTRRPRWKMLANALRKVWRLPAEEHWSTDERAMAELLRRFADKATRAAHDPYNTRAYLIDTDVQLSGKRTHAGTLDVVVVIGEHEQRQMILAHSVMDGYERYESLAALGEALPAKLNEGGPTLLWRLYEPPGDIFDYAACALIDLQLSAIGVLGVADAQSPPLPTASNVARVLPGTLTLSTRERSDIRQIGEQLPDWLATAHDLDISKYSRYVVDLAELHAVNAGQSFDDGIAPIREYVREQLKDRIGVHPLGKSLNLDEVEIRIETPVIWGTFALPGQTDITRRSLIDLTLENLTGLPDGQTSVYCNGERAPDWLSYSYLKEVIEAIDTGARYPALIKQVLLDDPAQSLDREVLYTKHLRLQLPLLALQWKIQRKHGLDDVGYRYIAAAMQANVHEQQVDGQRIVIRPLAFVPALSDSLTPDPVTNMFVIEASDHTKGPCLLYRPLLEPVLVQYPSRQNLIYAIKNSQSLRNSVLAWLPEQTRANYAQFVFPDTVPSPWTIVSVLIEPQVAVEMSGPITLTETVLGNDALSVLYKANVAAMVELATRQSVSNVQKRWASYREAGWRLFNVALPFFGSTVGIAAWIWQIMDDLQEARHAAQGPSGQTAWAARVDLLLNLGMALVMHITLRKKTPKEPGKIAPLTPEPASTQFEEAEKPAPVASKVIVVQLPSLATLPLPAAHSGALNSSGALGLAATLDSFKLTRPAGLGEQHTLADPYRHLYPLADRWYTPVGERWFEVAVDGGDNVIIVDPNDPTRTGPLLISNLAGQWFVDVRLRLRGGGGYKKLRRTAQRQKPSRIKELRDKLDEFNAAEPARYKTLTDAFTAIGSEAGAATDVNRQAFIEGMDQRLQAYEAPIRQLRSLAIIDTVPNYQSNMVDYVNMQLLLSSTCLKERAKQFSNELSTALHIIEFEAANDPRRQAEAAQTMSANTLNMITRSEYIQSRIRELQTLGEEGARIIQKFSTVPVIELDDLKAYRVTLSRYLCIAEGTSEAVDTVREQFKAIADTVDLNVQSVLEALNTDNDSSLDERVEVLNSLVEQFANVDQRLLDLHADFSEHVKREPLQNLREQIEVFNQRAVETLAGLLREQHAEALTARASSSAKAAQTPKKKIIKTRFHGVQIGEPDPSAQGLVDIKAPITGKVIATFHEKLPGVWVEREKPSSAPRPRQSVDLGKSINTAQTLLDEEPVATRRALALAQKPGRIPVEVEELFHRHAARLEHAQNSLEQALTQLNLTEVDHPSAAALNKNLNDAAQRLYALGTSTRISMIKQQPPTAARLEWLHGQGQVTIAKTGTRRRLKGPGKNYLDEYQVRDHSTHEVLWYAHFHYVSPESAVGDYVAGHLKTREQQRLGGAFQRSGLNDSEQIAIYRSAISPQLAQSLFFANAPGD